MKNNIELSEVLNALSNFDEFFRPSMDVKKKETFLTIPTNVKKTDSNYEVEMRLPGYEKSDISAEMIDSKHLKVTAQAEKEDLGGLMATMAIDNNHKREFHRSEYLERIVTLDSDVDKENIKASLDKGILTLFLPFAKTVDGKKILIK